MFFQILIKKIKDLTIVVIFADTLRTESFIFEDGTPVKFWGVILSGGSCFRDHAYAEAVARRPAQTGCNYVHFHRMDGEKLPDIGIGPIEAENIDAQIAIRTDNTKLRVWTVNSEGFYIGNPEVTHEDGWMHFHIGPNYPACTT